MKLYDKYKTQIKFLSSSLISQLADYLICYLAILCGIPAGISTLISRILSCALNYFVNRIVVFQKKESTASIIKFTVMCTVQTILCSIWTQFAANLLQGKNSVYVVLARIPFDMLMFLVSYTVQKLWIFPNKKNKDEK
jgi:GtrA-like protein.